MYARDESSWNTGCSYCCKLKVLPVEVPKLLLFVGNWPSGWLKVAVAWGFLTPGKVISTVRSYDRWLFALKLMFPTSFLRLNEQCTWPVLRAIPVRKSKRIWYQCVLSQCGEVDKTTFSCTPSKPISNQPASPWITVVYAAVKLMVRIQRTVIRKWCKTYSKGISKSTNSSKVTVSKSNSFFTGCAVIVLGSTVPTTGCLSCYSFT